MSAPGGPPRAVPGAGDAQARLFFALWPPPAVREALGAAARALCDCCGGRITAADSIHLTLRFLGDTPVAAERELRAAGAAAASAGHRFALRFVRLGVWPHNGIGWAGVEAVAPELVALRARLEAALDRCTLPPASHRERTRPFVPHVTLVRRAQPPRTALPEIGAIDWPVDGLLLVRSRLGRSGPRYQVLDRWSLPRR